MKPRAPVRAALRRVAAIPAIAAASTAIWIAAALPVRINWTTSAPLGVYSIHRSAGIARNDLVAVCLPDSVAALGLARGYVSAGSCSNGTSPVLKQVIAVAGDDVVLQRDFLAVNGRVVDHSRRHSTDSIGRPLGALPVGHRPVRDDEVWVLGIRRERSWDSRYFGPVPVASIVAIARPLLTLSAGNPQ